MAVVIYSQGLVLHIPEEHISNWNGSKLRFVYFEISMILLLLKNPTCISMNIISNVVIVQPKRQYKY